MKKNFATIRRTFALFLALALLSNTNIYASTLNNSADVIQTKMDLIGLEENTSVTYNFETEEITYGEDQDFNSSEQIEIEYEDAISPFAIIGEDNQKQISNTTDSPYRNVCQLTVHYSDGTVKYGSGTLVYFDVVLTAGHVVYDVEHEGWPSYIDVVPGRNGRERPLGTTYATKMTTSNSWINDANYDYDWAILDLADSFSTWQLYACYESPSVAVGKTINAIGYPGEKGIYYMYEHSNSITSATDLHLDSLYDTMKGQSGGAIIDTKTGYLVGIISHSILNANTREPICNRGTLITRDLFQRIKSHSN